MTMTTDNHGNAVAREGVDRCVCGSKYWEYDRCVDCGRSVAEAGRGASLLELIGAQQAAERAEAVASDRLSRARAALDAATAELEKAEADYEVAYNDAALAGSAVRQAEQKARDGGVIRLI